MKKIVCLIVIFLFSSVQAQQTVGLFLNDDASFNGYTLFGNNETTYLVNNCGLIVNEWTSQYKPGNGIYLLENGQLLRCGRISSSIFDAGGIGGVFELFSWEGELLWSYQLASPALHAHHDIAPLPNGNFLVLAWEKYTQAEAQNIGRKYAGEVWSERILEIEMTGTNGATIVWEWALWDHLIQDDDPSKTNYGIVADHPELLDINFIGEGFPTSGNWIHANAISYHPDLDQIAISSRFLSEIWIIDHSTTTTEAASHQGGNSGQGGDFLYRFGNPATYQRGTVADRKFGGQHDVRWIPKGYPNEGALMVFNNNFGDKASRIEMWQPPLNATNTYPIEENQPYGPDAFLWTYDSPGFYSDILSGAHVLPNGNVFICEGFTGHFFEVNPEGEKVWDYINPVNRNGSPAPQGATPHFNQTFRATRYAPDFPGLADKPLYPTDPVEINPWDIDCTAGEVISHAEGSEELLPVALSGNPVWDRLHIHSQEKESLALTILDLQGKTMGRYTLAPGSVLKLDVTPWPKGIYLVKISGTRSTLTAILKVVKL